MTDQFAHADAAYVLGALDPAEARAFEYHLAECAECRARVAEARSTVTLLASVRDAGMPSDPDDMPHTLLPGLLRRAGQERARRRWFTATAGALAAACLVALAVVAWPSSEPARPASQALHSVRPSPVRATAMLAAKKWGTEIDLHCTYEYGTVPRIPYRLRVIDRNSRTYDAGSWRLVPGKETNFVGGTEVRRDRIAKIQVTLPDGTPILQLAT